jgi:hypothetical protein
MTNVQLYLAIGLPVFSILVVWLGSTMLNNRSINALGQRIDDLRSEIRAGFGGVNNRLDRLETRFDHIEDEVRKDHEGRLARLEARVFARTA